MSTLTDPAAEILTQTLDEFVKQQVAEQGCSDEAEYFKKLAEAERQQKIWDYYEEEVIRGLESGPPIPLTQEFWDGFLREREERRNAKRSGKTQ